MTTSDDYHRFARESYDAAAKATTEAERNAFLQMAQTWEQAAQMEEGGMAPIEPSHSEPSPAPKN
jgi:hypothetical protein